MSRPSRRAFERSSSRAESNAAAGGSSAPISCTDPARDSPARSETGRIGRTRRTGAPHLSWANGIHRTGRTAPGRLKPPFPQGSVGSNPTPGTASERSSGPARRRENGGMDTQIAYREAIGAEALAVHDSARAASHARQAEALVEEWTDYPEMSAALGRLASYEARLGNLDRAVELADITLPAGRLGAPRRGTGRTARCGGRRGVGGGAAPARRRDPQRRDHAVSRADAIVSPTW